MPLLRVSASVQRYCLVTRRRILAMRGEFRQAGDGQVGLGVGGFDCADAGAGGGAVYPNGGEAESLGGDYVVVNALADVQHAMGGGVDRGSGRVRRVSAKACRPGLAAR